MIEHAAARPVPIDSHVVTVLAPTPQDAKYCDQILSEHGVPADFVASIFDVVERIRGGAGVLLIAQEFLTRESMELLRGAIDEQPSWSDVPILVLLTQSETSPRVISELLLLRHVTLIERPLRIALLVSTLKAKLRDRSRQYEVRDLLLESQQASDAKSAFVAHMSHEIRTPMTAILGYAEMLCEHVSNGEAQSYLSTIRRNGDYLLEIINDILDLSKIEAGKLDVDQVCFEPYRVIEDVRSIMEVRASEQGLDLYVEYESLVPELIESDPKRLKQILINLVGNAIKFTKQGSVRIGISWENYSSSLVPRSAGSSRPNRDLKARYSVRGERRVGEFRVSVTDTGIGMTLDQQTHLFNPFSQGNSIITQQFGGTGLGLAISQRLAKLLGGEISVVSSLNRGSIFTLTIAVCELKSMNMIQPTDRSGLHKEDASFLDIQLDAHILIVDDRRDIRYLSKRILMNAGATVTEAEDGLIAVQTVTQSAEEGVLFDLILLDMQMPNLDGFQTASTLRKLGYTNPIIALTADAMQGNMNKCLEAGCSDYLSKPIDKVSMLLKIANFLKM